MSKKRLSHRVISVVLAVILVLAAGVVAFGAARKIIYPQKYSELVEKYSREFGVEESLVYAVIFTESGFDPNARSNVGAIGLMQIMPDTFQWLQMKMKTDTTLASDALYEPETNIKYGVFFLSLLINEFGCDRLAIAAYHAGRGSVNSWINNELVSRNDCEIDDIPTSDTGHYVSKVEDARGVYLDIYY